MLQIQIRRTQMWNMWFLHSKNEAMASLTVIVPSQWMLLMYKDCGKMIICKWTLIQHKLTYCTYLPLALWILLSTSIYMHSTPCPVLCHTHVPMRSHTHTDTHLHTHTGSHASKRQNNYLKKLKSLLIVKINIVAVNIQTVTVTA